MYNAKETAEVIGLAFEAATVAQSRGKLEEANLAGLMGSVTVLASIWEELRIANHALERIAVALEAPPTAGSMLMRINENLARIAGRM